MLQQLSAKRARNQGGFTLIELLIAIVVVGILSAVVIIGVGSLTGKGSTSACQASADAAAAASVVHYANSPLPSAYPADFAVMVSANELSLANGTSVNAANNKIINGKGWSLTLVPGAAGVAPTFTCGP